MIEYFFICSFIFALCMIIKNYLSKINIKKTFDRLDKLFVKHTEWEKELDIYSVSMPKTFTKQKKAKCLLLISGYRDNPYMWNEFIPYLENAQIDYLAPRTVTNGRSFFPTNSTYKDWILTYMEAMWILQEQYETVDIVGFSMGTLIALYLTQFKYKCEINNLILCAPFLLSKYDTLQYILFESGLSWILCSILNIFVPFYMKIPSDNYLTVRNTNYKPSALNDYYELASCFRLDCEVMKFKNFRPKQILANNVLILASNQDFVIGDIIKQKNIISKIWGHYVKIQTIPSEGTNPCGHVMFKEDPVIINDIFTIIDYYIN